MASRLEVSLSTSGASAAVQWRPEILHPTVVEERLRIDSLSKGPGISIIDTMRSQLRELIRSRDPARTYSSADLDAAVSGHLGATAMEDHGVWVFYPWSNRLVHLLDEPEFAIVRTDRNRNKITSEEQERLSRMKVGIVGLSVGRSVAMAMALERSFGELRLADHDTLDLSNLNRIRAGVHELGLNKCIATAREIAELDPFLHVTCQPAGLTRENIDDFFTRGGRLDAIVEECDSVDIKIIVRQKARALRIPVLMDTSDRGMVDVERFDLEPERPILHGLIDHLDPAAAAKATTNEEKIPFLAPIAGMDQLSPRMKASMVEVGQTITTWPQLATGVVLGGALIGDVYRRMALGEFTGSGRWYVDLEQLINEPAGGGSPSPSSDAPLDHATAKEPTDASVATLKVPLHGLPIAEDIAIRMAEAGRLAPSADNMQPWSIVYREGRLLLFHDRTRSGSALDIEEMIPHVALGMCLENMLLAGEAQGIALSHELFPLPGDPTLIASIAANDRRERPGDVEELASQIGSRHTDRKHGDRSPLPTGAVDGLSAAISTIPGTRLYVVTERNAIDELAEICGAADRLRIMNEHGHDEFFNKQLRWTHEEAVRTGDGLDIETLELTATERVGLRMAASPLAMRAIRGVGGGAALEKISASAVRSSSAIALLTVPAITPECCIEGGRAAERLWLKATQLQLAVHPLSAPVFLSRPAGRPNDTCLSNQERSELITISRRLHTLFRSPEGALLFMARLSCSPPPTKRSMRRTLDRVLTLD